MTTAIKEAISKEKYKILSNNATKQLKANLSILATKDIIADKMIKAIRALKPVDIAPIKIDTKLRGKEEEIVLQLSDIQAGTYISKEATGGLNEYNEETLKQQVEKLLKTITVIITRQKQLAPIRKLNIHALGDFVEGIDIFRGQAQHVDQDLYDQIFRTAELFVWLFVELLGLFDEIEISVVGGNHGRVGKKGENPHYVNWDLYLFKYIEARLQNYTRIKFNIPKSWWFVDTIQGWNFLMLHGDDIKSWNGIPYYGIDRADAKWTKLLLSKGITYNYLELGHFHSPSELHSVTGETIINGCWPGGSMFALKSLVTSGRPRQNLFAVHPDEGKTWSYPIWLDIKQ